MSVDFSKNKLGSEISAKMFALLSAVEKRKFHADMREFFSREATSLSVEVEDNSFYVSTHANSIYEEWVKANSFVDGYLTALGFTPEGVRIPKDKSSAQL